MKRDAVAAAAAYADATVSHRRRQEREDQAYLDADDALFYLSEEEEKTLSEEEILARLEEALAAMDEEDEDDEWDEEEDEDVRYAAAGTAVVDDAGPTVDWMQNRRAVLGGGGGPDGTVRPNGTDKVVPVRPHELMTAEEIQTLLEAYGGNDVVVLLDDPDLPRMGGLVGMVVCNTGRGGSPPDNHNNNKNTEPHGGSAYHDDESPYGGGNHPYLITTLARVLVEHLKARRLHEAGLLGGRPRAPPPLSNGRVGGRHTSWEVVDCGNYVVHILDPPTRRALGLEALWSGRDPLWRLDVTNDDAVEDYCANHPVPAGYGSRGQPQHLSLWDARAVRRLERNQYTATPAHRPVVPTATKRRDRRAGKRKRREQRQQQ